VKVPGVVERCLAHPLARHPLVRRITGYSAGSVVALIISQTAFLFSYTFGGKDTAIASACGFIGGAVPNYILNRRWAWRDRRGRSRRSEVTLYMMVALASFFSAWACTNWAEIGARSLTTSKITQDLFVQLTYLGISAVFFVVKFLIYETLVFKRHPDDVVPEAPLRQALTSSLAGSAD
jgi:putative flippase GtrA